MAYAESGYEGHGGSRLDNITNDDIAAFGDLVAEIVGDRPESVAMQANRQLQDLIDTAPSPVAQQAIQNLIDATWPVQAHYLLNTRHTGADKTIAEQLLDATTAETAAANVHSMSEDWKAKRRG